MRGSLTGSIYAHCPPSIQPHSAGQSQGAAIQCVGPLKRITYDLCEPFGRSESPAVTDSRQRISGKRSVANAAVALNLRRFSYRRGVRIALDQSHLAPLRANDIAVVQSAMLAPMIATSY